MLLSGESPGWSPSTPAKTSSPNRSGALRRSTADLKVPDYRVLATGKALFVDIRCRGRSHGQVLARDAADLISVDYEELPVTVE